MAVDPCFLAFLRDVVDIWRPIATVNERGLLGAAVYELRGDAVPCALQPLRTSVVDSLTGQVSQESHVAYLEPTEIAVGDLVVERRGSVRLTDAVGAGSQSLSVDGDAVSGGWAVVGDGEGSELVLVETVVGNELQLSQPVGLSHGAGDRVWLAGCYEVVEARDEAGAGHHLRVSLRQWGG